MEVQVWTRHAVEPWQYCGLDSNAQLFCPHCRFSPPEVLSLSAWYESPTELDCTTYKGHLGPVLSERLVSLHGSANTSRRCVLLSSHQKASCPLNCFPPSNQNTVSVILCCLQDLLIASTVDLFLNDGANGIPCVAGNGLQGGCT